MLEGNQASQNSSGLGETCAFNESISQPVQQNSRGDDQKRAIQELTLLELLQVCWCDVSLVLWSSSWSLLQDADLVPRMAPSWRCSELFASLIAEDLIYLTFTFLMYFCLFIFEHYSLLSRHFVGFLSCFSYWLAVLCGTFSCKESCVAGLMQWEPSEPLSLQNKRCMK